MNCLDVCFHSQYRVRRSSLRETVSELEQRIAHMIRSQGEARLYLGTPHCDLELSFYVQAVFSHLHQVNEVAPRGTDSHILYLEEVMNRLILSNNSVSIWSGDGPYSEGSRVSKEEFGKVYLLPQEMDLADSRRSD
jgi:hypothetical protein